MIDWIGVDVSNSMPQDAGWFLDEFDGPRFWEHVNVNGGTAYLADPLARIDASAGECWVWRGWTGAGYGRFNLFGKPWQAHRIAYRDLGRALPDDLDIDHLCRNTLCVRASHLEPVTTAENVGRGSNPLANRTECRKGHALKDNILVRKRGSGTFNTCATCYAN